MRGKGVACEAFCPSSSFYRVLINIRYRKNERNKESVAARDTLSSGWKAKNVWDCQKIPEKSIGFLTRSELVRSSALKIWQYLKKL